MRGGSLWQRGAGGLACRLRRFASLSASAGPDQRLLWDSESSAQGTRLPDQTPCTSAEESPLPDQAAAARGFPTASDRFGWGRSEPGGLLWRRVLAAGLTAAGGTTSQRGLATQVRPKKRQRTSQSSSDERPTEPETEESDDLAADYKAVLKRILAGQSFDGFRQALRDAKRKRHLVAFHQAIVDELKHDPPARLQHEILLHSFAKEIRVETDWTTRIYLAKTTLCFKERVKELVMLALAENSLPKYKKSTSLVATLKSLTSLVEHTGMEMVEELRSDTAWVKEFRRLFSQELGREEPALEIAATFRLVRLAQVLRFSVSEDDCRGLCRAIRWELHEWEEGRTYRLRGKDLQGMLTWMRQMCFRLWEEETELMETVLCWLLDPANSDAAQHPHQIIEILVGLAADDFGAFSSAVAKVGRGSELGGLLSSLYGDHRRLESLDKRGQYFLYKLDSLMGINEVEGLPRMSQRDLDSLTHIRGGFKAHANLRVERCPLQQVLGRDELQKALGRVKEGHRLSQVHPLPFSARAVVVEHLEGTPVPVLAPWKLVHSLEEAQPPSELRLFLPLDEWELGPKGEPMAELSQQMAFLRRLGYDVVPFHLRFQGGKSSASSPPKPQASAKPDKEPLRRKAAKASAPKKEPSAKSKEAKSKEANSKEAKSKEAKSREAGKRKRAAPAKAPPPEPPEERAQRFRDARRKAQEGQWA